MSDELLALQRLIDGQGSSSEEEGPQNRTNFSNNCLSSSTEEFSAAAAATAVATSEAAVASANVQREGSATAAVSTKPATADDTDSDDEFFDLNAVIIEGKRLIREDKTRRDASDRHAPSSEDGGSSSVVVLPSPGMAIAQMEARLREENEARRQNEQRRFRHRAEDITHVSAAGDYAEAAAAGSQQSRRERWRQKKQNSERQSQQIYVGLPIGKTWHVPLVGIEGRGGYRAPTDMDSEKKEVLVEKASGVGKRKESSLTVKEREKLKRKKGQSSHATWKPEVWMQLRQQYD